MWEWAHVDYHVFERTALRTASSGPARDSDRSAGEVLLAWIVFTVARERRRAAVEEGAGAEVVGP